MKKFIAMFLCLSLTASIAVISAEAETKKECIYGVEDFEGVSVADKTIPSGMSLNGSGYSKVEGSYAYVSEENGNKFLEIVDNSPNTSVDTAGIKIEIPEGKRQTSGCVTLKMDVFVPNEAQHGFMINAHTTQGKNELSTSIVKNKLAQNLTSAANATTTQTVGTSLPFIEQWATLTFVLNLDTKKVDMYVGNDQLPTVNFRYSEWGYTDYSIDYIQIIGCNKTANPKLLNLDNISIYNYEKKPHLPPETTYLVNESFEADTVGEEPESGDKQYNGIAGKKSEKTSITVENKNSLIANEIEIPDNFANESKFVKFSDYTMNNSNSSLVYNFVPQTGKVAFEYDAYKPVSSTATSQEQSNSASLVTIAGLGTTGRGVALHQWSTKVQCYTNPDGGSTQTIGIISSADGILKANTWQHYKIVADYVSKTFDFTVDGNTYEDLPLRDNLEANLSNLNRFYISGATINDTEEWERTMYIDNIKAYRVDQNPVVSTVKFYDASGAEVDSKSIDADSLSYIAIEFSTGVEASIAADSVTTDTVKINGASYQKTIEGNTVKLYPALEADKTYYLEIEGVKDIFANSSLYDNYEFNTAAETDKIYFDGNKSSFTAGEVVVGKIKTAEDSVGVIALYNAVNKRLVSTDIVGVNAGVEGECSITVPTDSNTYMIKLFCFENLGSLSPVMQAIPLTQAQ